MIYFLSWTTKKHFKKSTFQATTFYVNEIFSTYQGLVQKLKDFSMTPSKIQGLFKTLPTLETLTDQATKIYLHFFLDSEAATREHAS